MQRFVRSFIISTLLSLALYFYIFYSETASWPDVNRDWAGMLMIVVMANILGISMLYLNNLYNQLFPWNRNITIRFLIETGSGIIIFVMLMTIFVFVYVKPKIILEEGTSLSVVYKDSVLKTGVFSAIILYLYSLVNFSVFSINQYAHVQIVSVRSERDQLNLQFEALKSQLSPHFLFNALNTISSLIYKDIRLADQFIRQMANTYHYILQTNEKKLIDIKKEVKMMRSYFFMQKTRFGDLINLNIKQNVENCETLIPPLTLQMLVENAIKHNHMNEKKTLEINIHANDRNSITVENNIIPKPELLKIGNNLIDRPKLAKSHKIGLSNIRQRYGYFTDKEIQVIVNEYFIVKLPVINTSHEEETIL